MNIFDFLEGIEELETFYSQEKQNIHANEFNCINSVYEIEKWQSMTFNEKLEYHRSYIITKQKLEMESNLDDRFKYEVSVINLLELAMSFLNKTIDFQLDKESEESKLVFRLRNIMMCEVYAIGRHKSMFRIGHVPFNEIVSPLFSKLEVFDAYQNFRLVKIYDAYKNMVELWRRIN